MQHKPRFSGILVVAVLMVLILFFVSLSPLLSASAANHINYSEIYYYFENQQVTSYRLDMGTNKLEMWLKEGKIALPDTTVQSEDQQTGGLLNNLGNSEDEVLRPMVVRCMWFISCPMAWTSTPEKFLILSMHIMKQIRMHR